MICSIISSVYILITLAHSHAYASIGIYARNIALERYHDTTGATTYGSPNAILTPVLQIGDIVTNTKAVMYNLHSEKYRGTAIDNMITCVRKYKSSSQCASLTDFLQLVQFTDDPNPAAILFHPVFPMKTPTHFVGFTAVVFVWKVSCTDAPNPSLLTHINNICCEL